MIFRSVGQQIYWKRFEPMKLYLGGYFAFFTASPQHWVDLELTGPARLADVLVNLGVPLAEVHLVVVNGCLVALDEAVVMAQDEVRIYPAVDGG